MILSLILTQLLTHAFFIWAQKIKNWGVIDIAWSLGFILSVIGAQLWYENSSLSAFIVLAIVLLWAIRLSFYLFKRNIGKQEDWRYAQFRQEWKPNENIQAYLKVFVFQGLLMVIITLPAIDFIKNNKTIDFGVIEILGLAIFLFGFLYESIADYQLEKFVQNKKSGGLMDQGLWATCRHPNYFGEVTLWWGFYLFLSSYTAWWTILGPVTITFFILKVTGVPLKEERLSQRTGYKEYREKTNKFFPWFPKKD